MTGTATLVVAADDPTPPYEQVRRQLADLIRGRVLAPGQRLPPVRQLAGDLGLAVGTVARAYRELESGGLVRSRRGGGTRVAEQPVLREPERRRLLAEHAAEYAQRAALLGADREEAVAAVQAALATGLPVAPTPRGADDPAG